MDSTAIAGIAATGVVGLAGTVAGFFAPAWGQRKIDQRRERRDFRKARRLLDLELFKATIDIRVLLEHGGVDPPAFETAKWEALQATLAISIGDSEWRALAVAYENLKKLGTIFAEPDAPPVELVVDLASRVRDEIEDARKVLKAAEPIAD